MDSKFFKSALYNGYDANAIRLGTALTFGYFWARTLPCQALYAGPQNAIDEDTVVAVFDADDEDFEISKQWLDDGRYEYARAAISHCGLESSLCDPVLIEIRDGALALTPNVPYDLRAEVLASGKVRLRWRYSHIGQAIEPSGFRIYIDDGAGFDFETPAAAVSFSHGHEFTWTSEQLTNGQRYKFCVRSYKTGGGESVNTNYVAVVPDNQGPDAITGIAYDLEDV